MIEQNPLAMKSGDIVQNKPLTFSRVRYIQELIEGIHGLGDDTIIEAVEAIEECTGKLMFIGNGASASIASHMAADFLKAGERETVTFTDPALMTCIINDIGAEHNYEIPVDIVATAADMLIAISSSGQSPNILNATEVAIDRGCDIITLSGFKPDNPLRGQGDINFYVPSSSYGIVEVVHTAILHCILDVFLARRG